MQGAATLVLVVLYCFISMHYGAFDLLLNARAHVVDYAVVLCMVLLNHTVDQSESLVCSSDHWSTR